MKDPLILHMEGLLLGVDAIHSEIDSIALSYVRQELRKMSLRYHRRLITLICGMGSSCIFVEVTKPTRHRKHIQIYDDWSSPPWLPGEPWMGELDNLADQIQRGCSSLPYSCNIKFKNGEEITDET